jgi:glyoxylase-like metal-dependent hydrolase (beta-lactamase superfamily II)
MYPRKINDSLWILGNDYFHIYLIRGSRKCALVETGVSATADIVINQLSTLKIRPDFIIVTHPHSDHITGLDPLRRFLPGAVVIAGQGAEEFVTHPKAASSMIMEDRHVRDELAVRGIKSRTDIMASPPSLSGCRIVRHKEELALGGLTIAFQEALGHSPGNILVHIKDTDTLLVSDSLGNHYPGRGFFPTFFTGFNDYLATIDRLEKFHPQKIGLAHNGFFEMTETIREVFRQAKQTAVDVRHHIMQSSSGNEAAAEELFTFYYTDELAVYSPQNIRNCCRLLVRRIRESDTIQPSVPQ